MAQLIGPAREERAPRARAIERGTARGELPEEPGVGSQRLVGGEVIVELVRRKQGDLQAGALRAGGEERAEDGCHLLGRARLRAQLQHEADAVDAARARALEVEDRLRIAPGRVGQLLGERRGRPRPPRATQGLGDRRIGRERFPRTEQRAGASREAEGEFEPPHFSARPCACRRLGRPQRA